MFVSFILIMILIMNFHCQSLVAADLIRFLIVDAPLTFLLFCLSLSFNCSLIDSVPWCCLPFIRLFNEGLSGWLLFPYSLPYCSPGLFGRVWSDRRPWPLITEGNPFAGAPSGNFDFLIGLPSTSTRSGSSSSSITEFFSSRLFPLFLLFIPGLCWSRDVLCFSPASTPSVSMWRDWPCWLVPIAVEEFWFKNLLSLFRSLETSVPCLLNRPCLTILPWVVLPLLLPWVPSSKLALERARSKSSMPSSVCTAASRVSLCPLSSKSFSLDGDTLSAA